jgi:hypothetical protein
MINKFMMIKNGFSNLLVDEINLTKMLYVMVEEHVQEILYVRL